jgi:radical SAM superfamily enzyme YgiQ (UPF0313 family)
MGARILVVDLNNFARYPSIAVGYLSAILRSQGHEVELFAPLSVGVGGVPREARPSALGRLNLEFRYRTAVSRNRLIRGVRSRYAAYQASSLARSRTKIVAEFSKRLAEGFDAVLISTYLMYYPHCVSIADACRKRGVPVVLGGPYFAARDVAAEWIDIPGVTALVGGEVETHLDELVNRVVKREPFDDLPAVWSRRDGKLSLNAPPLTRLDALPFPDYSDFPWSRYPNAIVPIITGRGCGWGVCTFCSDITSTAGRTFRSRSPENVLAEIAHQSAKHDSRLFVFTDLKLNSNLEVWRALCTELPRRVDRAKWIGAVHVGTQGDNGLSRDDLRAASAAGMVRLTTGFESGSQRVLDRMAKGVKLDATSQFLADASAAGISVRMTMFTGYPGEESEDIDQTTRFLTAHEALIERIPIYRFQIMTGTTFANRLFERPDRFPQVRNLGPDHRHALVAHDYAPAASKPYRKAMSRLFQVVHRINRKPLRPAARDFEGVM